MAELAEQVRREVVVRDVVEDDGRDRERVVPGEELARERVARPDRGERREHDEEEPESPGPDFSRIESDVRPAEAHGDPGDEDEEPERDERPRQGKPEGE